MKLTKEQRKALWCFDLAGKMGAVVITQLRERMSEVDALLAAKFITRTDRIGGLTDSGELSWAPVYTITKAGCDYLDGNPQ
jgi:hypothetical protein